MNTLITSQRHHALAILLAVACLSPWLSCQTTPSEQEPNSWVWQTVKAAKPPEVTNQDWSGHGIDRYIYAKLVAAGIQPATTSDSRTLIRRASLVLTGLPPTPEAIKSFLEDDSEQAFADLVDHLLNTQAYGEHQARHWLDLVRYAESLGHENDYTIPGAWRYRDYVIRAFQQDLPFKLFVREHIAGDLIKAPRQDPVTGTNESVIGTCFYWFSDQTHSPVDVLRHRADRTDNQIDVLSKTFLALTVSCARCHDHKFDPIPTADYYALSGYLKSSRFTLQPTQNSDQLKIQLDTVRRERAQVLKALPAVLHAQAEQLANEYETAKTGDSSAGDSSKGKPIDSARFKLWEAVLAKHKVPSLASFEAPADFVEIPIISETSAPGAWFQTGELFGPDSRAGEPRIERIAKNSIIRFDTRGQHHSASTSTLLEGELCSPTFRLTKRYVYVRAHGRQTRINLVVEGFDVIRNPIYGGLKKYVDTEQTRGFLFDVGMWEGHHAYLQFRDTRAHDLADPSRSGGYAADGYIAVEQAFLSDSLPKAEPLPANEGAAQRIENALAHYSKTSNNADHKVLDWLARHRLLDLEALTHELSRFRDAEDKITPANTVPGMADGTGQDEHIFERGSHTTLGPIAHRHFLTALTGKTETDVASGSGRHELADHIASAENPLTARVYVNRVWHHMLGRGIVPTVDNFGKLGQPATHPELLDWLTTEFIAQGWSTKQLIKTILTSRTWQMSSERNPAADELDPSNALLHRARIRRMSGEVIRDSLLAVSGTLDRTQFGPSIPVHLSPFMEGRGRPKKGPIDGKRRRSIYLAVRRNFLSPMFQAFDTPIPFTTIGQRSVSNVPAQALTLQNDPFVILLAADLAKSCEDAVSPESRINTIYERLLARQPNTKELALGLAFVGGGKDSASAAIWADYCHVLINQKEFYFIR